MIAFAALPLTGCDDADTFDLDLKAIDVSGLTPSLTLQVVRPRDLLVLTFGFVNLGRAAGNPQQLVVTGNPALVVVTFPPQHIFEQALLEGASEPASPVSSRIAAPSRVVFYVPPGAGPIDLTITGLLARCSELAMNVHQHAMPPGSPTGVGAGTTSFTSGGPGPMETALELPYRLVLSPNVLGRWAHATAAVTSSRQVTELWHTRLGVHRPVDQRIEPRPDAIDERTPTHRTVRALAARDASRSADPFTPTSLTSAHRLDIVAATLAARPAGEAPVVTRVDRLMLSPLGGTLDSDTAFPAGSAGSLARWQHRAAVGRDSRVEIVTRGYLCPFGHRAALVEVTERKISFDGGGAFLRKRWFIVVEEPVRQYVGVGAEADRRMPLRSIEVKTLVTPDLDPGFPAGASFIPKVGGVPFLFELHGTDRYGNRLRVRAPVKWIIESERLLGGPTGKLAEHNTDLHKYDEAWCDVAGQRLALAERTGDRDDTSYEMSRIRFTGAVVPYVTDRDPDFAPAMHDAKVVVEATRAIAGVRDPVQVGYHEHYMEHGFGPNNPREVMLALATPIQLDFTKQADRSGGFVTPNFKLEGLSRKVGPISDLANLTRSTMDPANLFPNPGLGDAFLPRLFGCIELKDLFDTGGAFDAVAPRFVTEALDDLATLVATGKKLRDDALALRDRIGGLSTTIASAITAAENALVGVETAIQTLSAGAAQSSEEVLRIAFDAVVELQGLLAGPDAARLTAQVAGSDVYLRTTLRALRTITELKGLVGDALTNVRRGLELAKNLQVSFEWRPPVKREVLGGLFLCDPARGGGLVLSGQVRGRDVGNQKAGLDLVCSLENFSLVLIPPFKAIRLDFKRFQFRQTSGKKPEIDVILDKLEFLGPLSFINALKDVIPLDGFSDPPNVKIGPDGLEAGFTLALPNLAVGVFSLENVAIGAALKVPFLGDAITLAFNFCSRENPFLLTASGLGGGGFVGITLSPKGLQALEVSLEFGAHVSINLGVASGAVSVMAGIYLKILATGETDLVGFVRIRGEVDVLGLISASIELRMELRFRMPEQKVIGRATLEIEVSVAFFSKKVKISCERRFAGSNGDPVFSQIMGPSPDLPDPQAGKPYGGKAPPLAWLDYCRAFASA